MKLLLLAAGLGFTVYRDPSVAEPYRWSPASVTLRLQQDGSADVPGTSDDEAVRGAMAAWSTAAAFTFVEGPPIASRSVAQDGINVVTFYESGWPGPSGVVALTTHRRSSATSPGTLIEADVYLNGQDFTWATDGDLHAYDVQSVVTHELGHVLGLHHSADPLATMFFASRVGMTYGRTLGDDDRAGARYLYPSGAFSCSVHADCPLLLGVYGGANVRRVCSGGSCSSAGTVPYGGDCTAGGDCDSGLCASDPEGPNPFDPGFCSVSCSAACPAGDYCDGSFCLRARVDCDDTGPAGDAQCGSGAGDNVVCTRDLDGRYRCNRLCVTDAHCPTGECWFGVDSSNPGFCLLRGAVAAGACDDAFDCQSLICTTQVNGAVQCVGSPPPGDSGPAPGDSDQEMGDGAPQAADGLRPPSDRGPAGDTDVTFGEHTPQPLEAGCACGAASAWAWIAVLALVRRARASRSPM